MLFTPLHKSSINNALEQGLSFALYRDKGDNNLTFICDDYSDKSKQSDLQFFAVKWLGKFSERIVIADRLTLEQAAEYKSDKKFNLLEPWQLSTDYNHYIPSMRMLIDELNVDGGKVVISKVNCGNTSIDIATVAELYFEANKSAYCCLLHTPDTGCWLIASPELLLSADFTTQTIETVALAGTREIDASSSNAQSWDKKNLAEQHVVSEYISQTFSDLHIKFKASNNQTIRTNNIEHIATFFTGKLNDNAEVERIIDTLNPTPALCGSPREFAIKRIRSIEQHQRRLYGGYFGFVNNAMFKAIVTLRCAQLSNNKFCIYAGGGITADSNAHCEWNETVLKSQVLSNILMKER